MVGLPLGRSQALSLLGSHLQAHFLEGLLAPFQVHLDLPSFLVVLPSFQVDLQSLEDLPSFLDAYLALVLPSSHSDHPEPPSRVVAALSVQVQT